MYPMLINGEQRITKKSFNVINPSTGAVLGLAPELDVENIQLTLKSARQGFEAWSAKTPAERKAIILRYAELIDENSGRIIELLRAETGKPQDNAEYDFGMLSTCLRFFVEEVERLDQPVLHDPDGRFLHYMLRQPLGVCVGMLAWNFPLLNVGYKIGPALAAGCSVILKPSSETPLASLEIAYLAKEAGLPDGVINMVTGTDHDMMKNMLQSDIPSMVTMIGSTRGGLEVMNSSCSSVKHFSVELGGNAPVVVYPDADIKNAAEQVTNLKFANCGQICVSPNRVFVHESIYNEFVELALGIAKGIEMGPLVSDKARQYVLGLVESAKAAGAEVVLGGNAIDGDGFFMEPTILRNVSPEMDVSRNEVFGPVMSIIPFSDSDDEIALANDTEYGLAAYVFTTNLQNGLRAARDIQAGSVCVNEVHYSVQLPHGGLKQSGVGKDCSRYSLEEYLTLKRVSVLVD
ncbi:Succinate-semialdehyde dehydrogenase [NADP(+)] GabD [Pontiella desulfatans]|uniref:Succinate-semialdehyde dehydrogenase [NADP(+)] GabD n=2 Tax=Pontiella desulfatans TaxID=2750659 RepID=A0A6C2U4F5_PONDE|nr:Succinate-semialdehyde dehydrogenase [NADP(+)] GabD [Pontiella desulfatans]